MSVHHTADITVKGDNGASQTCSIDYHTMQRIITLFQNGEI